MSSLVDYGDSEDENDRAFKATVKTRKHSLVPLCQERPGKHKVAKTTRGEGVTVIEEEEELPSVASSLDRLTDSKCLVPSGSHEKSSLQRIDLSPESLMNLRENVKKLLSYNHGRGKSILHHISESPQFQNPYCLETIMSAFKINPYASNFPIALYDPEAIEVFEGRRFAKFQMAAKAPETNRQPQHRPTTTTTSTTTTTTSSRPVVDLVQQHKQEHSTATTSIRRTTTRRSNKWDVKKK